MRVDLCSADVSWFAKHLSMEATTTYATVSPSTMTLICHMARPPRPDMASGPT